MISKEYISYLKNQSNGAIEKLISSQSDSKSIVDIFKHLGYIPKNYDVSWVVKYLGHSSKNVRLWAVKTLGKVRNEGNYYALSNSYKDESVSEVQREIISSIGRMRMEISKTFLYDVLKDDDPKIISQAIRALLVFKGDQEVDNHLKLLSKHENEIISEVISKEYFEKKTNSQLNQKHSDSYSYLRNKIVLGDTRDVLRLIPDESFHLTFTSPPYYNARDYSIYKSYQAYLDFLEEVFELVYSKTKEGRFLIINTSPIIIPRISRQHSSKRYPIPFDIHNFLIKMGWEFIDDIIWLKPEACVKNRVGSFQQHRKPLAYKPNSITEYLMVYRKETSKLLDWNIKQYEKDIVEKSKVKDEFETTNVWKIDPKYNKVHSAVFPIELCKRVIKYYSYIGDLVFDPFAGSGTFGRTAKSLNRYFFLTEKEQKYFDYMKSFLGKNSIFNNLSTELVSYQDFANIINKDKNDTD